MKNKVVVLSHGFVSVHPNPAGIVHFIGGYFFGTGVQCWYRSLLEQLQQRFTVHSYSYSFAELSHWKIASDLLAQIEQVKQEAIRTGQQMGFQTEVYSDPSQHCLVGHSLGCECIALIRFLGFEKQVQLELLKDAQRELGTREVTSADFTDVQSLPQSQHIPYRTSLCMAPCFKTPTAISGLLKVRPQDQLVQYLIQHKGADLLPLTSLIFFSGDTIASPDVSWLQAELQQQERLLNFDQIDVQRKYLTALQYHMIPAFDPIDSGLAAIGSQFVSQLIGASAIDHRTALILDR
ncbi:MAG: DUF1350 family protein [Aphanocapsa sp. GSE-SYN-MK-11-07L]|jgi:hypothetical protein|nr:DUF1350 family protein [Aphanocapsa sp. GSE-SYN-MK-11-07L]